MNSQPILVTGAAGFIGARFVEELNLKKIPVISVDQLSHFDSRPEHNSISFTQKIDRDALFDWLKKNKPTLQAIVHLGACTDTTEFDVEYLNRVNTEYSKKIWNYCTENKIPLVYASSAATYGEGEKGYDDNERIIPDLKPLNPYGDSKQLFDLWVLDQEKKGLHPPSWSGFKFFNVYGFGERHKQKMASVVLAAFDQIRSKGKVRLFKSHRDGIAHGHQKRDFICVEDVVSVLLFALSKPIQRGIFNLGSGKARTFLDLVRSVFVELGQKENIEFIDTPIEIRDKYQYFTEARMERLLSEGYTQPFRSLEEGVKIYIDRLKQFS